jgi:hypothetical protein
MHLLWHVSCSQTHTYIEYRVVSGDFRTVDPPPPLHPASVSSPPHQRRGGTLHTRRAMRGWGVNISEDARHWIGLLQYNLSMPQTIEEWNTKSPRSSSFWVPRNLSHHMDRQARTLYAVLVTSRELEANTAVVAGGRSCKDDRKQNTLAILPQTVGVGVRNV